MKIILSQEENSYSKYYLLKQDRIIIQRPKGQHRDIGNLPITYLIIHTNSLDVLKPRFPSMLML